MSSEGKLIRAVGLWGLVAFNLNLVIGSGVYLLPSRTFALLGPFSLWAPLLFSIPVFILAMCFAEASSRFDESGGAYLYTREGLGELIGFETGWMTLVARVTSLASLANGFVLSLDRLVPGVNEGLSRTALLAGSLVLLATIDAAGIRMGARTVYALTWGKIIPLVIFVVVALIAFRHNPLPASLSLDAGAVDWGSATLFLIFAYGGFENLGVPASEFRNPERNVPRALIISLLAIAAVYALVQLAAMATITDLSTSQTPIADAAGVVMGDVGITLVTVGAIISILGTNMGTTITGSRLLYSLTRDRRPFRVVGRVFSSTRTPILSTAVLAGVAIPIALAGTFETLALVSAGARLVTYLFTAASVPKLRKLREGFTSPGGLLIPLLGVGISLYLMSLLTREQMVALGIAALVGLVFYGISAAAGGRVREPAGETADPR